MTPERLERLAAAWGADLRRWPGAERIAAEALLARDAGAQSLLDRAVELDALLDAHAVAAPDAWLLQAVLAGAPANQSQDQSQSQSRYKGDARRRHVPRRWWWSGAGLAGVGLAGTAFGAIAVAMALSAVTPAPVTPALDGAWAATAFDAGNAIDGSDE